MNIKNIEKNKFKFYIIIAFLYNNIKNIEENFVKKSTYPKPTIILFIFIYLFIYFI